MGVYLFSDWLKCFQRLFHWHASYWIFFSTMHLITEAKLSAPTVQTFLMDMYELQNLGGYLFSDWAVANAPSMHVAGNKCKLSHCFVPTRTSLFVMFIAPTHIFLVTAFKVILSIVHPPIFHHTMLTFPQLLCTIVFTQSYLPVPVQVLETFKLKKKKKTKPTIIHVSPKCLPL